MGHEYSTRRYKRWYAKLLNLYPQNYREQMGESMEQTFTDLLREHTKEGRGVLAFVIGTFVDTLLGIIKEGMKDMKTRVTIIVIALVALTEATLVAIWALNGYEDTWFYVAAGIIAIPTSWFAFGKKEEK